VSAGDWARWHKGDFDLPWDLPGNYGLINVSDRFPGNRKDFSSFTGLSVDAMFLSDESIPFDGTAEIEVGLGFITPGVGTEDEDKSVFGAPQLLTDIYQTFTINFSDLDFVQTPEELAVDLAQFAFIKIRVGNTEFNSGLGTLVYDEVYGLLGSAAEESADFDGDGDVDGRDFLIWQRGFGQSGQADNSLGDANLDGTIDSLDLGVWQNQFGQVPLAAVQAVPECSSLVFALIASLSLITQVRNQRRA
jgi:Dockerin type I domain